MSVLKRQKLFVANKQTYQQQFEPRHQYPTLPLLQKQPEIYNNSAELNQRLNKLQGNLKILEKKYRDNLKEGFESKIKAYRLEAVFERKVLKNAMREIQKQNQATQMRKRWSNSQKKNELYNSRIEIMKAQRYQRHHQFKELKKKEKTSISICLHENKNELSALAKQSHDKIIQEEQNINKKKDYFTFLRKSTQKKQQYNQKKQLLERIYNNTEKLKQAKEALSQLNCNQQREERSRTFLTI